MSARVVIAAVAIAAVVVAGGAFAVMSLTDVPDSSGGEAGPERTKRPGAVPEDVVPDDDTGPAAPASDLAPEPADGGPWLEMKGWEEFQRQVDWREVGKTYAELVPLLEARARLVARDAPEPPADSARIDALRADLERLAQPIHKRADYCSGHGVLVHPAFLLNSIPATLHARGVGLTVPQLEQLQRRAVEAGMDERFVEEGARETDRSPLNRAAVECEVRRGFADRMIEPLTKRQRKALHSEDTYTRVGLDCFQGVEVFRDEVTIVAFDDNEDLARQLVGLAALEIPIDDLKRARATDMIGPLLSVPRESVFPLGVRNVDRRGYALFDTVVSSCQQTEELMGHILRTLSADADNMLIPLQVLRRPIILMRNTQD